MGLIKKVFGPVLGLIAAVFKGIFGIFGLGKQSEYFLELEDASGATSPKPQAQPKIPSKPAQSALQTTASEASTNGAKPSKVSASAVSIPKASAVKTNSAAAAVSAPSSVSGVKSASNNGNFATDYLLNPKLSTGSRRRPGPSLSAFKEMARQVGGSVRG